MVPSSCSIEDKAQQIFLSRAANALKLTEEEKHGLNLNQQLEHHCKVVIPIHRKGNPMPSLSKSANLVIAPCRVTSGT